MTSARHRAPRWSVACLVLVLAVGWARVAATYGVFSETFDEGAHLAAGLQLLDRGEYTYDRSHPPLARIAIALGPYLAGSRSHGRGNMWSEGRAILTASDIGRTLFLARLGVLPFFVLAAWCLWAYTRRIAGDPEAVAAVLLFSATPIVLAFAGLATTDLALTGSLLALLYVGTRWLEEPTLLRAAVAGAAGAAALTSKLSSVVFVGVTLLVVVRMRHAWGWATASAPMSADGTAGEHRGDSRTRGWFWRILTLGDRHVRTLPLLVITGFVLTWAVYGFQHGTLRGVPFPMTALIQAVRELAAHNSQGHAAFLLGSAYTTGDWRFFPVGIGVKAPLPLLVLGVPGLALLAWRARAARAWQVGVPVALATAVLGVAMAARINIGVRHVLPLFAMLALGAGVAWCAVWRRWRGAAARVVLVGAAVAGLRSTVAAHPDYLAYFNELAGRHPERILVDSDLDWGQDLWRLRDTVRSRGIERLTIAYFGHGDLARYGIPVGQRWDRGHEVHGWFAVSQTFRQRGTAVVADGHWTLYPDALRWLDAYEPEARIGRGFLLYRIP